MAKQFNNADELAIAVGHALSAWTGVELAMDNLFTEISGLSPNKAHILMATIISFETRLAVCSAFMEAEPEMNDVLELWHKVATKLAKGYKSRHHVAHFTFLSTAKDGNTSVTVAPYFSIGRAILGKNTEIGVAEINQKQAIFEELKDAVHWFWQLRLMRKHGITGPQLKSDLIHRLQNSIAPTPEAPEPPPQSFPA